MKQHRNKESFYTKKFSGIEMVYTEIFLKRSEVKKREKQVKKWSVAKKKALILGDKQGLIALSKCREVVDDSCDRE